MLNRLTLEESGASRSKKKTHEIYYSQMPQVS